LGHLPWVSLYNSVAVCVAVSVALCAAVCVAVFGAVLWLICSNFHQTSVMQCFAVCIAVCCVVYAITNSINASFKFHEFNLIRHVRSQSHQLDPAITFFGTLPQYLFPCNLSNSRTPSHPWQYFFLPPKSLLKGPAAPTNSTTMTASVNRTRPYSSRYVCACMYVCMYVCTCVYVVCTCVYVCMCVYVCINVCMCVYMYVCVCMYKCIYVCMYVCVCMYV